MIKWSLWLLAASLVARGQGSEQYRYKSPRPAGNAYLAEHFDNAEAFKETWIPSRAIKEESDEETGKYDGQYAVEAPSDENHLKGDLGLVLKSKAKHYALSSELKRPFIFDHRPLIVQYEVQFQNGMECGGAYIKLLSQPKSGSVEDMQTHFNSKTRYSIMFGPDKCGTVQKLHLIFQHKSPKTGFYEEKHWKDSVAAGGAMNGKFSDVFNDKKPHQYTLILDTDNTFEIKIDGRTEAKGHMLEDFEPAVNPPQEIEDTSDTKPEDWDEREMIPDPEARKPDDWDENEPKEIEDAAAVKPEDWLYEESALMPDPEAKQPADWDEDMDGTWEAPLIDNPKCKANNCGEWKAPMVPNPKYKGKWRAPLIDNPAYKGKWKRRLIPNPNYFRDMHPFRLEPVVAVGFELWTMTDGVLFDNILVTDDVAVAAQWSEDGFHTKRRMLDKSQSSWFASFVDYSTQYPWLWAIYVLVLGVPAALFVAYFCMPKSSRYEERGRSKKSDLEEEPQAETQPLVDVTEENDEGAEAEEGEASDGQVVEEEEEGEEGDEEEEEDAEDGKDGGDKPEAEQIARSSKPTKEEGAGESHTRKRRNRKD